MTTTRRSAHDASTGQNTAQVRSREIVVVTWIVVIAVLVVIGIAAAISYSHMFEWAKLNGETDANEWRARIFPISVDGAVLAGSMVLYVDSRAQRKSDRLAYVIVLLGIVVSIGANIGHDWVSWFAEKIISAWPPLAMALVVEMLFQFLRRGRQQADDQAVQAEQQQAKQTELAEKAQRQVERRQAAPEVAAVVVAPDPVTTPEPVSQVAEVDLSAEMVTSGWAPTDYANAGEAMLGYLTKVDSTVSGAELDQLVGARFFDAKPGRGRQIVRKFKEGQAAIATGGKE